MPEKQDLRRSERETIEAKERGGAPAERTPDSPTELSGTSKKETFKRTFKEFMANEGTDKAAALTYYAIQALFPALIALVSIAGHHRRFGHPAADRQPQVGSHPRARPRRSSRAR